MHNWLPAASLHPLASRSYDNDLFSIRTLHKVLGFEEKFSVFECSKREKRPCYVLFQTREINILQESAIETTPTPTLLQICCASFLDFERKILEIEQVTSILIISYLYYKSRYQAIMLLHTLNDDTFLISYDSDYSL